MALPEAAQPKGYPSPGAQPRAVTARSVGIGLLCSAVISGWITYSRTGANTSAVNITHLPVSFFAIFMLVVTANLVWRSRPGRTGLASSELLTIL